MIPTSLTSRDLNTLTTETENIYKSVAIISKRAAQISAVQKIELTSKLAEFASPIDNLEEIFENKEQIEISRYYERLPKNTIVATEKFLDGDIMYKAPETPEEE